MSNCSDIYNHCRPPHTKVILSNENFCVPYLIQDKPDVYFDPEPIDISSLISDNPVNMCSDEHTTYNTDNCEIISSFIYDQNQIRNIHYKTFKDRTEDTYCKNPKHNKHRVSSPIDRIKQETVLYNYPTLIAPPYTTCRNNFACTSESNCLDSSLPEGSTKCLECYLSPMSEQGNCRPEIGNVSGNVCYCPYAPYTITSKEGDTCTNIFNRIINENLPMADVCTHYPKTICDVNGQGTSLCDDDNPLPPNSSVTYTCGGVCKQDSSRGLITTNCKTCHPGDPPSGPVKVTIT